MNNNTNQDTDLQHGVANALCLALMKDNLDATVQSNDSTAAGAELKATPHALAADAALAYINEARALCSPAKPATTWSEIIQSAVVYNATAGSESDSQKYLDLPNNVVNFLQATQYWNQSNAGVVLTTSNDAENARQAAATAQHDSELGQSMTYLEYELYASKVSQFIIHDSANYVGIKNGLFLPGTKASPAGSKNTDGNIRLIAKKSWFFNILKAIVKRNAPHMNEDKFFDLITEIVDEFDVTELSTVKASNGTTDVTWQPATENNASPTSYPRVGTKDEHKRAGYLAKLFGSGKAGGVVNANEVLNSIFGPTNGIDRVMYIPDGNNATYQTNTTVKMEKSIGLEAMRTAVALNVWTRLSDVQKREFEANGGREYVQNMYPSLLEFQTEVKNSSGEVTTPAKLIAKLGSNTLGDSMTTGMSSAVNESGKITHMLVKKWTQNATTLSWSQVDNNAVRDALLTQVKGLFPIVNKLSNETRLEIVNGVSLTLVKLQQQKLLVQPQP